MKEKFDIFMEGYNISGNRQGATFIASVNAYSFKEACDRHFVNDKDYNSERLTVWGCKLYETLEEAQKHFG